MACATIIFHCFPTGATLAIDSQIKGVDKGSGISVCLDGANIFNPQGSHSIVWAKVGYTQMSYFIQVTDSMLGNTYHDYNSFPAQCTSGNCPYPKTCYNDKCGDSPDCNVTNCPYPGACEDQWTCGSSCNPITQSYGRIFISPAGSTVTVVGDSGVDHVVVPSTSEGLHLCLLAPYYYHTLRYEHPGYITQEERISVGAANTGFGDRHITLLPTGSTCDPPCTLPKTCKTVNGIPTCTSPDTECIGFNRNGSFDISCIIQNPLYLLIGAAVIVLLISRR